MLIDSSLALRSNLVRKGIAQLYQFKRVVAHRLANANDFSARPPVIANSIPKSGTHLLLQLTRTLPGVQYYGSFVAWSTSRSLRPHAQDRVLRNLLRIAPGETLGAHLHFSGEAAAVLNEINAVHFFIVRDPRDIIVSEAQYLHKMNRWHRMHREFASALDQKARIKLSICGSQEKPELFPDFGARSRPFLGWLHRPDAVTLRYEDLASGNREAYRKVATTYLDRAGSADTECNALVNQLIAAVNPEKSHTYRRGVERGSRGKFDSENEALFEQICGPICRELGYE